MANLIVIRGKQNSGKTTTAGLIYGKLFKKCGPNHKFGRGLQSLVPVSKNSLKYDQHGNTIDFIAVFNCNGKTIVLISEGDVASDLKRRIKALIGNADVIICFARSVNRKGSAYRMILEDFKNSHPIILERFTKYAPSKESQYSIKKSLIDEIMVTLESILKDK